MHQIGFPRLIAELEKLYQPPFGAKATFRKIRQALEEVARHGRISRVDRISPGALADWLAAPETAGRSRATRRIKEGRLMASPSSGYRRASELEWVGVADRLPRLGETIWVAGLNQTGKFRIQRGSVTETRATGVRVWPWTGYWAATHWAYRGRGEQVLTVDIDKIESRKGARHATR